MGKNIDQHYVPRLYLRKFACDESCRCIDILRVSPYRHIGRGSIAGQCQSANFYKDDGMLDEMLTEIESMIGNPLKSLLSSKRLDEELRGAVEVLAVTMLLRTQKATALASLMPKDYAYWTLQAASARNELREPPGGFKKEHIRFRGAASLLFSATFAPLLLEMKTLECALVTPHSGRNFITSDHPVILLNPYFSNYLGEKSTRSFSGFGRSGFILTLPLSPQVCVLFYDSGVYSIPSTSSRPLKIGNQDLDTINGLQIQSALRCVFSNGHVSEDYYRKLWDKYSASRTSIESHQTNQPLSDRSWLSFFRMSSARLAAPLHFCRERANPRIGPDAMRHPAWSELVDQVCRDARDQGPATDAVHKLYTLFDIGGPQLRSQ